jgi:membrane fusion protein, heavy metal efflux system
MSKKELPFMRKYFQPGLIVLFASSLGLCCSSTHHAKAEAPAVAMQSPARVPGVDVCVNEAQMKEINLQLAPVRRGLISKTVDAPGQVQPDAVRTVLVSTPSQGRAIKVISKLGDTVKAGDIMCIIKSDPIGQTQSDLLQNVLQADSDIKQQEVALKLDHITFDRESILYKEQVSAKADLQAAENALEKDDELLRALQRKRAAYIIVAQERLTLEGAPPDSAQKVIATKKLDPWVVIKAPRSGLVIERAINPGEMNDGSHELFTLADLSQVWLVAQVFEKDVQAIKEGQEGYVTLDSLPDHKFPAKIVWVGSTISPTNRTLPVRANVDNPKLLLRPNMFARIRVDVGRVPALLVPNSAVVQRGDKSLVFVKKGIGVFTEREVEPGIADDNDTEIIAGVKPGEVVVTDGTTELLGAGMKTSAGR